MYRSVMRLNDHLCHKVRAHHVFWGFRNPSLSKPFSVLLLTGGEEVYDGLHEVPRRKRSVPYLLRNLRQFPQLYPFRLADRNLVWNCEETNQVVFLNSYDLTLFV